MKLTLYDISNDYREAVEKLSDLDLPPEVVEDTLEGLQGTLEAKAIAVASFAGNLEATAEQIKQAEAKMAHRRRVLENRAASVRAYIKTCMESAGISKVECPYFKMAIRQNPPSVEIFDFESLPEDVLRKPPQPPPEPDKKLIGDRLKAGQDVPGARLKTSTRLDIK